MKYFKNVNSYNELKKAYRELLKANHPDNGGNVEVMQAINVEYEALFPIWKNKQEKESGEIINETAAETRRKFYTQFGWEGSRYDCDLSLKEIAKIVRTYIKEKYPTYKFSVRIHYASMCQELTAVLKESPIEIYKTAEEASEEDELAFIKKAERHGLWNLTSWTREVFESEYKKITEEHGNFYKIMNEATKAVIDDVDAFVNSYNYDDCDGMIDYFDVNFYYLGCCENNGENVKIVPKTARIKNKKSESKVAKEATSENINFKDLHFEISEDVDTRNNEKIYCVKISEKLTREEYKQANEEMKARGGYYSRFKHAFIFKEDPSKLLGVPGNSKASHIDDLEEYKKHILKEIEEEAAAAGTTVEEYANNDYELQVDAAQNLEKPKKINGTVSYRNFIGFFEVCETPETCQFYLDCVEFSATKNYITDCELLTLRRVGRQKLKKLKGENSYYKKEPEDFAKKYYEINEENARLAQELNRFSKYETGSATRIYHEKCDFAYSILDKILDEHPEQAESTAQKIDYYCKKLAEYYNDYYRNEASCPSVLICGPANFPSKKKERQNERRTLLIERWNYLENYLSKIQNFFNVSRPIKFGDPDAIEQLEKKITELESEHKLHLSANKYYKKHKTLQGFEGLTSAEISQIESLIRDPSRFVPFYVSNETANLRRYKSRLERLKKEKNLVGTCESVTIPYQGVVFKMVENTENMRLQLFFEGKPSEEIRALLKSHSFRWSGKNKCWQRQLTNNARFSYKRLKEELKNLDGIKTAAV